LLKKQPLKNFDLRDEGGRVLPLLSREENGKIASAILVYLAEFILDNQKPKQKINDSVKSELNDIAMRGARQARAALSNLASGHGTGSHHQRTILWASAVMRVLATDFASNFILMTPIEASAGDRRVVKFSYEQTIQPMQLSPFRHPLRWAGIAAMPYAARIASLGTAGSYHLEIAIPDDLFFISAGLYAGGGTLPLAGAERSVARAHLYSQGMSRDTPGIAVTYLRVRSSIVLETLLASSVTSAVIGTGLFLHWRGVHPSPDALTALVVILPAAFSVFLVRPGVHPVVLRLVTGLRAGILLSAVLSFVAAGTLAVTLSGRARLLIWSGLFAVSAAVWLVSVIAYIRAVTAERHA
jgi:hypothetical protein